MSDPIPPEGLQITKAAIGLQVQGQIRILVAGAAGAIAGRLLLPDGLIDDRIIDAVTALIMIGAVSAWQWARTRLVNSRWWHLAMDPRVPDELVRPASPTKGN